ncbi:MAG: pyridoxal-phosphate dependent enzyme [Halioglobus sp.]|nr:pyridoxal-phosphate dependent enzyme [Halioglobus sp.]
MDNVRVLRLDRTGGPAPGNKSFKLAPYLERARQRGVQRLVSFGGAWSNHLHALAATGAAAGFDTVGIVRCSAAEADTPMLADAMALGMQIVPVGRQAYRRRNEAAYLESIEARFAPCLLVPEGGASAAAAAGCAGIARLVAQQAPQVRQVVLAVGTGTTLAGVAAALDARRHVLGVSALKGAHDLDDRVRGLLHALLPQPAASSRARWSISHDFHCGGFARSSAGLREFILEFEAVQGIPLDPVYTAKAMYAVQQLLARGLLEHTQPLLVLHTGGLQGRRGFPWLAPPGCGPSGSGA